MPSFSGTTPEALLARNDSLNPEATCRGITSNGRPCRRPLLASPGHSQQQQPHSRKKNNNNAKLAPSPPGGGGDDTEDSYCWQHKDQAGRSRKSSPGPRPAQQHHAAGIAEERSSLDTLADRLGLVDINAGRPGRYDPEKLGDQHHQQRPSKPSSLFCFCFSIPSGEDFDDAPRPHQPRPQPHPVQPQYARPSTSSARPSHLHPHSQGGNSHSRPTSSSAPTAYHLKSLIPDSLDAVTTSALMTEVSKPPSDADEPGYIYMFWLTPESASEPAPVDAARDLLAPPPRGGNAAASRRPSDVVSAFANQGRKTNPRNPKPKTMLLKIGRAANVQRRMNQWSRQCGHSIQLLRFYPYLSSSSNPASFDAASAPSAKGRSPSPASAASPHPTPHVKKVERLIHIELTGMGLRADLGACETCGREHKEWFEVEASRDGVRTVDDIIRRWVGWDDGQ
ncbi:meiotically up-regulated gene 113 domain-containing protein [Trichoderma longibrachiatum]